MLLDFYAISVLFVRLDQRKNLRFINSSRADASA